MLLGDPFNDADLAGWTASPLGGLSRWTTGTGTLNYNGGGHTQLYTGQSGWTDYSVEAKIRLVTLANYPGGLRGRINPSTGAGYEVWLYPASGRLVLFRVTGWAIDSSGLTELGRASVAFDTTDFHRLGLEFAGASIAVKYDGVTVITTTDATHPAGAVGLDVSNQKVEWDDVLVVAPGGP